MREFISKEEVIRTVMKSIESMPSAISCESCGHRHMAWGFCPMVHMAKDGTLYELNGDDDYCSRWEKRRDED